MKFLAHGNSRPGARGSGPGHGVSGGSRGVNADAGRQRAHIFGKIAKPGIHNAVRGKGMRAASRAAGGAVLMQLRLIKPGSHGGSGGAFSDGAQPAGGDEEPLGLHRRMPVVRRGCAVTGLVDC